MFLGKPGARFIEGFSGYFDSKEKAISEMPSFVRLLNDGRDFQKQDKLNVVSVGAGKRLLGIEELDCIMSHNRRSAKEKGLQQKREELQKALRAEVCGPVDESLANSLACAVKASTNANHVVGLLAVFSQAQQAQRNKDNKRRAQERRNALPKKKRTEYKSYYLPMLCRVIAKKTEWQNARQFLAPFIRDQTTDGLVLVDGGGVDLSVTETARILKKAAIVHLFCGLRLQGASAGCRTLLQSIAPFLR
jgi:hypothetical protein